MGEGPNTPIPSIPPPQVRPRVRGLIKVVHCPTEGMIADYSSKPLQGALFRKFRDLVLGTSEGGHELHKAEYTRALEGFGLGNNQVT